MLYLAWSSEKPKKERWLHLPFSFLEQISDISVDDYITATAAKHATYIPHTAGRYQAKRFRKAQCPIVERLTNSLMMHGRNNGKKLMAVRIVKHAMEIIHLLTDLNPIQVIVDAVINRYINCFPFPFIFIILLEGVHQEKSNWSVRNM